MLNCYLSIQNIQNLRNLLGSGLIISPSSNNNFEIINAELDLLKDVIMYGNTPLIPTLTSNTSSALGSVISSGYAQDYYPYYAYNNNMSSVSYGWAHQAAIAYNGFSFVNPVSVYKVSYVNTTDPNQRMTRFKIQYSDNGSTWLDASQYIYPDTTIYGAIQTFNTDYTVGAHKHWRFYCDQNTYSSINYKGALELQLYGH